MYSALEYEFTLLRKKTEREERRQEREEEEENKAHRGGMTGRDSQRRRAWKGENASQYL